MFSNPSVGITSSSSLASSRPASPMSKTVSPLRDRGPVLECDYDVNPTYLYQAIEAKQWEHVAKALSKPTQALTESSTWVLRKETNGKLRWRLLPLHAAVIFQSPVEVIEMLLRVYPAAAQCKDDQGMLPLHLAFRNQTEWEVIEELLAAYPQAIQIKDRKGRTPVSCATGAGKKKASALELYTQIAVTAERQRANAESRTVMEARISALQDTHVQTLHNLRREWEEQMEMMTTDLNSSTTELTVTKLKLEKCQNELGEKSASEIELTAKLTQVTSALTHMNETRISAESAERLKWEKKQKELVEANEELLILSQSLLDQQTSLKIQLDKQSWESKDRREERETLQKKFASLQSQHFEEEKKERDAWRSILHQHNQEASQKLSVAMNKAREASEPPVQEITTKMVDFTPQTVREEEKKD